MNHQLELTQDGHLVLPADLLAQLQWNPQTPLQVSVNNGSLLITNQAQATFQPKTPLGQRLWQLRQNIVASGVPLLEREAIATQLAESRERV